MNQPKQFRFKVPVTTCHIRKSNDVTGLAFRSP